MHSCKQKQNQTGTPNKDDVNLNPETLIANCHKQLQGGKNWPKHDTLSISAFLVKLSTFPEANGDTMFFSPTRPLIPPVFFLHPFGHVDSQNITKFQHFTGSTCH